MNRRARMLRRTAGFAVTTIVATALVGLSSGPAGAGVCLAPSAPDADGRARALPSGSLLGNGVYNLTGVSQTAIHQMQPGDKESFEVTYRNASTKTRTITVGLYLETGPSGSFVIKYFRGDKEITASFDDGKQFKAKPPGSTTTPIRVQVRMRSSASITDHFDIDIRGAYGKGFPECGDNVLLAAGQVL